MASADDGPAADPNGPPVLVPELDRTARGSSTVKSSADAEATIAAADRPASLTSVPAADSNNGVIVIEWMYCKNETNVNTLELTDMHIARVWCRLYRRVFYEDTE